MFVISWDPNNKLFRARSAKVALIAGDENGSMELQHVLKLQEEGNMKSLLKPNQSTNPKEKKQIV